MEPHEAAIEAKSGQDITVIPNRTMLGIIALMEGRAHMAMISASLESEIGKMKKAMPGLDYDRLKAFEISSTAWPLSSIRQIPFARRRWIRSRRS